MKVGGTQRRLLGALTFFLVSASARCLRTFFSSADFRVRDSGTTNFLGLGGGLGAAARRADPRVGRAWTTSR
jgi:hypothetical protein